jgi:hypothetical protein
MLPDIARLRERARSLAVMDEILCRDEEARRYFFSAGWRPDAQLFWMDNGTGDDFSIAFLRGGTFVRGFDHESPLSPSLNDDEVWPGLLDGVPADFESLLQEESFLYEGVFSATFCIWRLAEDRRWSHGNVEFPNGLNRSENIDGSDMIRVLCEEEPRSYLDFAESNYGRVVSWDAVSSIWRKAPLTDSLVRELNPSAGVRDLVQEAEDAGYPVVSS